MEKKNIRVVAAVIREDGRVFATQRGYGNYKDWWEFPGGKIEPGETPEAAVVPSNRAPITVSTATARPAERALRPGVRRSAAAVGSIPAARRAASKGSDRYDWRNTVRGES